MSWPKIPKSVPFETPNRTGSLTLRGLLTRDKETFGARSLNHVRNWFLTIQRAYSLGPSREIGRRRKSLRTNAKKRRTPGGGPLGVFVNWWGTSISRFSTRRTVWGSNLQQLGQRRTSRAVTRQHRRSPDLFMPERVFTKRATAMMLACKSLPIYQNPALIRR